MNLYVYICTAIVTPKQQSKKKHQSIIVDLIISRASVIVEAFQLALESPDYPTHLEIPSSTCSKTQINYFEQ